MPNSLHEFNDVYRRCDLPLSAIFYRIKLHEYKLRSQLLIANYDYYLILFYTNRRRYTPIECCILFAFKRKKKVQFIDIFKQLPHRCC